LSQADSTVPFPGTLDTPDEGNEPSQEFPKLFLHGIASYPVILTENARGA
jgi:hypothetical protein